jgi:hypothetical protein
MVKRNKAEDTIHLRAIKYGIKFPNGFMYSDIKYHYSKRPSEWTIVNEYLNEAWNNKNSITGRVTPFVLLEMMGNGNADQSKYTLSYEAYFNYLGYLTLLETRKNSRIAFWTAFAAIFISVLSLIVSIYYQKKQLNMPTKVNQAQFQELIRSIQNIDTSVLIR